MDRREIFQAIDHGGLEELVASTNTTAELNVIHEALFRRALEEGVPRDRLIYRIDEATYQAARNSLLDPREMKQMSRKMLEDYDPRLALDVYRSQIRVMYAAFSEVKEDQKAGIVRPEETLFNEDAWGQTLATAGLDGTPAVAVFTKLARLNGDELVFGRIGQDQAYQNLKENPRGVFSAVGPSNDPTATDFVTISVELKEDHTDGEALEHLRTTMGGAVTNAMVFSVSDIKVSHLPNPHFSR